MPELAVKSGKSKRTRIVLKYISEIFIDYEGKDSNFTVEKFGTHHLTKKSRLPSPGRCT